MYVQVHGKLCSLWFHVRAPSLGRSLGGQDWPLAADCSCERLARLSFRATSELAAGWRRVGPPSEAQIGVCPTRFLRRMDRSWYEPEGLECHRATSGSAVPLMVVGLPLGALMDMSPTGGQDLAGPWLCRVESDYGVASRSAAGPVLVNLPQGHGWVCLPPGPRQLGLAVRGAGARLHSTSGPTARTEICEHRWLSLLPGPWVDGASGRIKVRQGYS